MTSARRYPEPRSHALLMVRNVPSVSNTAIGTGQRSKSWVKRASLDSISARLRRWLAPSANRLLAINPSPDSAQIDADQLTARAGSTMNSSATSSASAAVRSTVPATSTGDSRRVAAQRAATPQTRNTASSKMSIQSRLESIG